MKSIRNIRKAIMLILLNMLLILSSSVLILSWVYIKEKVQPVVCLASLFLLCAVFFACIKLNKIKEAERVVYSTLFILFLYIGIRNIAFSNIKIQIIYIGLIMLVGFYYCYIRKKIPGNNITHANRLLKNNFVETESFREKESRNEKITISRKGNALVMCIYLIYIYILAVLSYYNILSWSLILCIVFALLFLNNYFEYDNCLIRKWAFPEVKCCAGCHIVGWDYVLIFSVLFFSLFDKVGGITKNILVIVVCSFSVAFLMVWEWVAYFYPQRIDKEHNAYMCYKCQKPCTYKEEKVIRNRKIQKAVDWFDRRKNEVMDYKEEHYVTLGLMIALAVTILEFFLIGKEDFLKYYWFLIVAFFELSCFWIVLKWIQKKYEIMFEEHIKNIIVLNEDENCNTFTNKVFKIEDTENLVLYFYTLVLTIGFSVCSVIYFDNVSKYLKDIKYKIAFLIFLIVLMFACKAFIAFYNAYHSLVYYVNRTVKSDYYSNGYHHFVAIKRFVSLCITVMAIVCLTLFLAFMNITDIYSANSIVLVETFLGFISICPISIYIASYFQLKKVKEKMKSKVVSKFDEHVNEVLHNPTSKYEDIKSSLEIREFLFKSDLEKNKDYISTLLTVALGVAQLLVLVFKYLLEK